MSRNASLAQIADELNAIIRSNKSASTRMTASNLLKKLGLQRLSRSTCEELLRELAQRDIDVYVKGHTAADLPRLPGNTAVIFSRKGKVANLRFTPTDSRTFTEPTPGFIVDSTGSHVSDAITIQGEDTPTTRFLDVVDPWLSAEPEDYLDDFLEVQGSFVDQPAQPHGEHAPPVRGFDEHVPTKGMRFKRGDRNHWIIERHASPHPAPLFTHQEAAVEAMASKLGVDSRRSIAGLLVIPTGGGKTRTAVHWLLRDVVNRGGKVLWVAHRTELLDQAAWAFRGCARSDLLTKRKEFTLHLISGQHNQAVKLRPDDDVVIASMGSLRRGSAGEQYLVKNWLSQSHDARLVLVIDEAHHAPARTYRHLIDILDQHSKQPRILGLTATPYRTAKSEQGSLAAIFKDDILHKCDLRQLIASRVLATPEFITRPTHVSLRSQLTDEDFATLQKRHFDWMQLGDRAASTIGENRVRNRAIVDHYVEEKATYGQTIVFALNVPNAVALDTLFRERGIRCQYVVGDQRNAGGTASTSASHNRLAIDKFRKGELDVLVNVNILTEGVDLPNTRTIFLARPTTSRVLMMQMIGRGLRGTPAQQPTTTGASPLSKEKAYIVSFLDDDDWQGQIQWVSPQELFIEENVDFLNRDEETRRRTVQLISLKMLQEYTRLMDAMVSDGGLTSLQFRQRIPIGFYSFPLAGLDEEDADGHRDILIYDGNQLAYESLLAEVHSLLDAEEYQLDDEDGRMPKETLASIALRAEREYFIGIDPLPGYRLDDISSLIRYVHESKSIPPLIRFEEREKYDVDRLAAQIRESERKVQDRIRMINEAWEAEQSPWRDFFANSKARFLDEIYRSLQRLDFSDAFAADQPKIRYVTKDLESFTLQELRTVAPKYYRELIAKVRKSGPDGKFACKACRRKSPNPWNFEIDHITPRQHGGKTRADNLQLLCRKCNRQKGGQMDAMSTDVN